MNFPNLVKRLVDKDKRNESREYLLRETGKQSHHRTGVERHQPNHKQADPHSDPEPEVEVGDVVLFGEFVDDVFEDERRSRASENDEGLTSRQRVDHVT